MDNKRPTKSIVEPVDLVGRFYVKKQPAHVSQLLWRAVFSFTVPLHSKTYEI